LRAALSRTGLRAAAGPLLLLGLGLFAYRPLLLSSLHLPGLLERGNWFFDPDEKTPLLALGISAWLLWRRRGRLLSLPPRSAPGATVALLLVAGGLFVWAQLTRSPDLLLPSLGANLLAFAGATRGRAGCRAVLLPALVLLLGVPIPAPIRNELVWQLQQWTARGAAWAMAVGGFDATLSGLVIRSGERSFTVIEACSGLRGIEILTLVAVAIRELFADSGRRAWLLVVAAPWLGLALNVLRVTVVAATSGDPQEPEDADHTPQGVAVLLVGTGILYAIGWWMARGRGAAPPAARPEPGAPVRGLRAAGVGLAALALVSVAVPPFPRPPLVLPTIEIRESRSGWSGDELPLDDEFFGPMPFAHSLYRRYQKQLPGRPPQVVYLFVGIDLAGNPATGHLFTPKLAMPGRDWSLAEPRRTRLWLLDVEAEVALASRDSDFALVYSWHLRNGGIWRETSRAALALESGPLRRERRRAVVRLASPMPGDGHAARNRAKAVLDRFVADFREDLAGL
jgi:exosortase